MNAKWVTAVLSVALIVTQMDQRSFADDVDRWRCTAFLKTAVEKDGKSSLVGGSGFFIKHGETVYLVTALHVASQTAHDTQVLFTQQGQTGVATLSRLGLSDENKWQSTAGYDLAILRVEPQVLKDFYSCDTCICQTDPAPIKSELEFVGFPFAVGVTGNSGLQPVVVDGRVASTEIDSPFVPKVDRVILATPSIGDGTSGAPVFCRAGVGEWRLLGVYAGNLLDRSGAKLSKVVPIRAMMKLIEGNADSHDVASR